MYCLLSYIIFYVVMAFDCISWEYLDWVLGEMNFPPLWRSWIKSCVMSASASVLINGSPSYLFELKRGLRQGDPLSPFLFNLAVEPLNLLFQKAIALRKWEGIGIPRDGMKISHLQYADDTIVFCPQDLDALIEHKKKLDYFPSHLGSSSQFP